MAPPRDASSVWKFLHRLITLLKPLFCKLKIEGGQNVPEQAGCILACNHTYGPDFIVLGYASPRQVYYMAKMEIFGWHPLLTKLLVTAGVFPVRRGQSDKGAIMAAVDLVRTGKVVGMFPEGTRSHSGALQRGRSGAARIAMAAQVPVVPVVVLNSQAILHKLGRRLQVPEVVVRFGPPIYVTGDPNDSQTVHDNTTQIMLTLAALLPTELRGVYTTPEEPLSNQSDYVQL